MSGYTLKRHLSAPLIRNHTECLSGVTDRIYSPFLAAENGEVFTPGNALQCVKPNEVLAKEGELLGASKTDDKGNYSVQLSEEYDGGALEIDVNIETPISLMSGPGSYFEIADTDGQLLHTENRNMGCTEARKNAHHCFYEEISVDIKSTV